MDEEMLEHRGVQSILEEAASNMAHFFCVWFVICMVVSLLGGCSQSSVGGIVISDLLKIF